MKIQITYRHEDLLDLIARDIRNRADITEMGGILIENDFSILQDNKYVNISPNDICISYIAAVDSQGVRL
jgi:hypothetical protein